ncbi:MAG: hypothetical protein IT364_16785 [Candidatus Hydrogenedentes bacterium]|nr:hypothetical protein [Candidatus Hydrogenedentota bacterium]
MTAICLIRDQPHYRRDAFVTGLQRAGYAVTDRGGARKSDDLLVIWNRYGANEQMADAWEAHGGTVLVAENGYIGGDDQGRQRYALAAHGHNGSGWWPRGGPERFAALGLTPAPWVSRPDGHALVCGQRGIGSRSMASPPNWHVGAAKRSPQPARVRVHPGNKPDPKAPTLEQDLTNAKLCVVWSSTSGVKALLRGIPVVYDAPHWICEHAATRLKPGRDGEQSVLRNDGARQQALEDMAWAQWTVDELASGEPFVLFRDAARAGRIQW